MANEKFRKNAYQILYIHFISSFQLKKETNRIKMFRLERQKLKLNQNS